MYRFIRSEEVVITKELAKRINNMPAIDSERTLKTPRLAQLRVAIEGGQATVFRWAIARVRGEAQDIRVNGQHSSHLLANGVTIPPGSRAIIEYYECDERSDLPPLWSTFDPTMSARNSNELLQAFAGSIKVLEDCSQKTLRNCVGALAIEKFGFGYVNRITSQQRHGVLAGNEAFVIWVDPYVANEWLRRVGVTYAMLKTYRRNETEATEFWNEVVSGKNTNPDSGSRQLQKYLIGVKTVHGGGVGNVSVKQTRLADWALSQAFLLPAGIIGDAVPRSKNYSRTKTSRRQNDTTRRIKRI